MLRAVDTNGPAMHVVLEQYVAVWKQYAYSTSEHSAKLKELWETDWKYLHSPMHSAAYVLNPSHRGKTFQHDPKLWPEFMQVVLKLLG